MTIRPQRRVIKGLLREAFVIVSCDFPTLGDLTARVQKEKVVVVNTCDDS